MYCYVVIAKCKRKEIECKIHCQLVKAHIIVSFVTKQYFSRFNNSEKPRFVNIGNSMWVHLNNQIITQILIIIPKSNMFA